MNGQYTLASFSTTNGALVNLFTDGPGNGSTFAVSSDGSTHYVPGFTGVFPNLTGVLNEVSSKTGQVVQSIALALPAQKAVLLFPSGAPIAVNPLPVAPGITNLSIAFPQVVKQQ